MFSSSSSSFWLSPKLYHIFLLKIQQILCKNTDLSEVVKQILIKGMLFRFNNKSLSEIAKQILIKGVLFTPSI